MASEPFELIAGPFSVYVAPVGTAMPAINATPSASWTLLGTGGNKNMTEDGVTATHEQKIEHDNFRMFGTTGSRKAVRTAEDFMIEFTLADFTLEQYTMALNGAAVVDTPAGSGTAGYRKIPLRRGPDVHEYALLLRGPSAYGDGWNSQYQVPRCYQAESPKPKLVKGAPAGLIFQFKALEDPDAAAGEEFGLLVMQDAAPL